MISRRLPVLQSAGPVVTEQRSESLADLRFDCFVMIAVRVHDTPTQDRWDYFVPAAEIGVLQEARLKGAIVTVLRSDRRGSFMFAKLAKKAA